MGICRNKVSSASNCAWYQSNLCPGILAKRYIEDHPEALAIHSMVEFEYNGIRQGNRNTLLTKNIGVDGLKTGHIEESGYHLVATAKREGQRMIAVVMGCDKVKKRGPEAQKLLEYGFKNFSSVEAVKRGASFGPLKVRRGKLNQVGLTVSDTGWVTVPRGKESLAAAVPQLPDFVTAPIQQGQVLAKVLVQKEGKRLKKLTLLPFRRARARTRLPLGGGLLRNQAASRQSQKERS